MLYSQIYKKYFPINHSSDVFFMSDKERKILSKWIKFVELDIEIYNVTKEQRGIKTGAYFAKQIVHTYSKSVSLLADKIKADNYGSLEKDDIDFINDVIYRHKYISLLSAFVFPIRKKDKPDQE